MVHTSLSILNCPSIPDEDASTALVGYVRNSTLVNYFKGMYSFLQRWFVNGELKCFKGGHLFLTLAALSVLVFCVFLIVIGIVIPIAVSCPSTVFFRVISYIIFLIVETKTIHKKIHLSSDSELQERSEMVVRY